MTQIEVDTMRAIQLNLAEIAKQLKLQNKIAYVRTRIANGGFADRDELNELKNEVAA